MPKSNPLVQGLERQRQQPPRPTRRSEKQGREAASAKSAAPPSRQGRRLIGAHFAPEVQTALKVIAAEESTTVQDLLAEAINTIFAKRHKPQIAGLSASQNV